MARRLGLHQRELTPRCLSPASLVDTTLAKPEFHVVPDAFLSTRGLGDRQRGVGWASIFELACLELPFLKAQERPSGSRHEWAFREVAQGSFTASSCNRVQQCLIASSVMRGSSLTRRSGLLQRRESEAPVKPQRNRASWRDLGDQRGV